VSLRRTVAAKFERKYMGGIILKCFQVAFQCPRLPYTSSLHFVYDLVCSIGVSKEILSRHSD
jgi:hypothetical protein